MTPLASKLTPLSLSGICGLALTAPVHAQTTDFTATQIIDRVNARDDGEMGQRDIRFDMTNRKGRTRTEETKAYRRYFGKERRTIIFYTDPTNVRGTGFLTYDYPDPSLDDDQWLYLPALRKVRRISASDRGDYFLGTDFTYEDIKKEQKVESTDYDFTLKARETVSGHDVLVVEGTPKSADIAADLGYSKVVWHIDPDIWMSWKTDYFDRNGNALKTTTMESFERIDDILTATSLVAVNHKTGHSTKLTFSNIDYKSDVPEALFTQARLRRGL